jgi:hypothetical protein
LGLSASKCPAKLHAYAGVFVFAFGLFQANDHLYLFFQQIVNPGSDGWKQVLQPSEIAELIVQAAYADGRMFFYASGSLVI